MKIRARITLWITLAGLLVGMFFSLVVYWELREQAFRTLDNELKATIRNVYQIFHWREPALPPPSDPAIEIFFDNRRFWIKVWRRNELIYTSRLAARVELPATGPMKETISAVILKKPPAAGSAGSSRQPAATAFRVRRARIPAVNNSPPYRIQVALPMEKLDEELNEVLLVLALGLPGAALLLILLSWFLAGRILKPVQEIATRAREIDEKGLSDRLPVSPGQDELHDLATALNQMLDRLQYSFRRQQEFIAGAAHELNTPLTSLRLSSEQALADPGLNPRLRAQLLHQQDTLLRMGRLLRSLMLLSALELQPRADIKPLDLSRLLNSVLEDLAPLVEHNRLKITIRRPPRATVCGDQEKLRRVLINLIENAIKYSVEEGEIELELSAEKDGGVTLEVINQVPRPLPREALEQVFDQFFRVEKSRSREFGGCGLGLTIVKEIVTLHQGDIRLENRPGNRVAAILTLPGSLSRKPAAGAT